MAHGLVLWVTQAGAAPGRGVKEQQCLLSLLPHPQPGSGEHKHLSMQSPRGFLSQEVCSLPGKPQRHLQAAS